MKVAIACSKDKEIVPLDQAEFIEIYDDQSGKLSESENPGYGSKEATMASILRLSPDVIAVREGVMCPGSYMMSQGSIKYALIKSSKVEDIIKNKEYADAKEELAEELFAE
ncbi:MAG: hypothetical protein LVQ97_04460 [Candidatus Micrarchaeales archaeon]|jgi:hypothetical protein|uniref:Dinitrogenase iron-molybdenum cofactor biosynthesis domain-containing protein n=1 Tax=Candidatus Micrarchaeum acidiphilum ARMAN-2 TaxID=425595 RepID=C7DH32_MICA2|nr:MAG: hypothetical protein UNLARM2_0378 [Candidatus Micrarchaeum acidiphilum ARMAN-2]MCW6161409.1 hypothetical protein [Candidatus Micrarchaeales archaeon]